MVTLKQPLRVLSLGAGVQSTAVLLMMIEGQLPKADAVIFADTGWEPIAVYDHLKKLELLMAKNKSRGKKKSVYFIYLTYMLLIFN